MLHIPRLCVYYGEQYQIYVNLRVVSIDVLASPSSSMIFVTMIVLVQGNLDPGLLFGTKDIIEERVIDLVRKTQAEGVRHVMNLGHGVLVGTPEENVAHFFEVAKTAHERME